MTMMTWLETTLTMTTVNDKFKLKLPTNNKQHQQPTTDNNGYNKFLASPPFLSPSLPLFVSVIVDALVVILR